MRFRVLGALNVFDGKDWLDVGAAKWRSLLAALVVRAPDVVSMDQLVLELWGDRPPRTATAQVYGYVLRLRRLLGDHDGRLLRTLTPRVPARRRRRGRGCPPLRCAARAGDTRRCRAGRADAGDVLRPGARVVARTRTRRRRADAADQRRSVPTRGAPPRRVGGPGGRRPRPWPARHLDRRAAAARRRASAARASRGSR